MLEMVFFEHGKPDQGGCQAWKCVSRPQEGQSQMNALLSQKSYAGQ